MSELQGHDDGRIETNMMYRIKCFLITNDMKSKKPSKITDRITSPLRKKYQSWVGKMLSSKGLCCQILGAVFSHWILCAICNVMILLIGAGVISLCCNSGDNQKNKTEVQSKTETCKNTIGGKQLCIAVMIKDSCIKTSKEILDTKQSDTKKVAGPKSYSRLWNIICHPWFLFFSFLFFSTLIIRTCLKLIKIFNLRVEERRITISYIVILCTVGLFIIGILIVFDVKNQPRLAAAIGVVGTVLTWVFQDTIKGVAAFMHLRANNLLHIGDWIKIPKHDVDGEIKRVSLTTVTIYNWDTTTSSIPTSLLHSEHFQNLQNMMVGKTYGRRMLKAFVFDTNWFCSLSKEDIEKIEKKHNFELHFTKTELESGILNAKVYRLYLYHWLMKHDHVSHQPRLMVRWLEQKESGMPLEVYAFITDSSLPAFEWQQSLLIEHIIESSSWFNMQLFQEASAYDVSNSNIYLTNKTADYRKEDL